MNGVNIKTRSSEILLQNKKVYVMGKVNKTDREWQRVITRRVSDYTTKGTEPAFTGQYWNTKRMVPMFAVAAAQSCSHQIPNMIAVAVGQVSSVRSMVLSLMNMKI